MGVFVEQLIGVIQGPQVNAAASSADSDPASIGFVKQQLELLSVKSPVRVAVSTNVNLASPGATLDGVSMNVGDSFLSWGQSTASANGIYIYNGSGVAATRRLDANSSVEIVPSMMFLCQEGTYADKIFKLTTNAPIVVDTTALTFSVEATVVSPVPTAQNKNMAALNTSADGDLATNSTITSTPAQASYVSLVVGSILEMIGDGTKSAAAYVSGGNGATARAWSAIQAGDKIFWNGTTAGYQLKNTWKLHLMYSV